MKVLRFEGEAPEVEQLMTELGIDFHRVQSTALIVYVKPVDYYIFNDNDQMNQVAAFVKANWHQPKDLCGVWVRNPLTKEINTEIMTSPTPIENIPAHNTSDHADAKQV